MANAVIEINTDGLTGLSLTIDVYPEGSDAVAFTSVALTEATNRKGVYTGTVSNPAAGDYQAQLKSGSTVLGDFYGPLTNMTNMHLFALRVGKVVGLTANTDPLANPLGNYASNTAGGVLQNLGKATVTVVSPVTQGGTISIIQGDDYKATDNRAILFALPASVWGNLTNATVAFVALRANSQIGPLSGTIVNGNTSGQSAQLELAGADTSAAKPSENPSDAYLYAVRITKAGDEITTFRGRLILARNLFD
ncbi:MAG: hypothetical protein HY290_33555 [Planctomycetia bacterium]|nr:hypothetical protein [Planctomycetia bacterium]